MKKILFWLLPLAFFSCEKTTYSPNPEDDKYTLTSMVYYMEGNDRMETFVRPLHSLEYANHTDVEQRVFVDPLADIQESSLFMSDDEKAFSLLEGNAPTVAVPIALTDDGFTLGEGKWPYSNEKVLLNPSVNYRDTITVPPNTRLSLTMNVYLNEFDVSYTALFEGSPTGAVAEIKGKWKGVAVANVEKQVEFH